MKITFDGKEIEVTQVAPGAVKKTDSIFYIQDSVTGEWNYSFKQRLDKLLAKNNGDLSGYKNRATLAKEKAAVPRWDTLQAKQT